MIMAQAKCNPGRTAAFAAIAALLALMIPQTIGYAQTSTQIKPTGSWWRVGTSNLMLLMLLVLPFVTACVEPEVPVLVDANALQPMDEVPVERRLPNADREYRFANGCVVVLQPDQAVVTTESDDCLLFQRDIALLYASAD